MSIEALCVGGKCNYLRKNRVDENGAYLYDKILGQTIKNIRDKRPIFTRRRNPHKHFCRLD